MTPNLHISFIDRSFHPHSIHSRHFTALCERCSSIFVFTEEQPWLDVFTAAVRALNITDVTIYSCFVSPTHPVAAQQELRKLRETTESLVVLLVGAGYSSDAWFDSRQYRLYPFLLRGLAEKSMSNYVCVVFPHIRESTTRWLTSGREKVYENIYWPEELKGKTYLLVDDRLVAGKASARSYSRYALGIATVILLGTLLNSSLLQREGRHIFDRTNHR